MRQDFALARFRKSIGIWPTRETHFPVASTSTSNKAIIAALQAYKKASMASRTFLPFLRPLPLPPFLPIFARLISTHPLPQQSIPSSKSLIIDERGYGLIYLKRPPQKSRPPYKIPFHRYRTTYTEQHHSNYPYTTSPNAEGIYTRHGYARLKET